MTAHPVIFGAVPSRNRSPRAERRSLSPEDRDRVRGDSTSPWPTHP